MKILFFIESLRSGGKERRLVELLTYLTAQNKYQCHVVVMFPQIDYPQFHLLNVPYTVLERKGLKKDPSVFFRFYKVCRRVKPDIIHSWGSMASFYALPTKLLKTLPLVNSQITDAPKHIPFLSFERFINVFNFSLSTVITSNSQAGLNAFHVTSKKAVVVHNGINLNRKIINETIEATKKKYGIATKYAVVMVANYSAFKKNQLFVDVANAVVKKRNDISFISVGGGDMTLFEKVKATVYDTKRILLVGKLPGVEAIVNACDIGVLFTNGEGISNAILEYMLLQKPVIAHEYGGTAEFVKHKHTGIRLQNDDVEAIATTIIDLIDYEAERKFLAENAYRLLQEEFTVDKMGKAFEAIYSKVVNKKT